MNAPLWICSACSRPAPDRIRNCVCVSSRCFNTETGLSAPKIQVPWRDELRAAVETLNRLSDEGTEHHV